MLLSVLLFATISVAYGYGNSKDSPLLFSALINISSASAVLVFLSIKYWHTLTTKITWRIMQKHCLNTSILFALIGGCAFVFTAFSLRYIDISIAMVIIFGIEPILSILLLTFLFKSDNRYRTITGPIWGLMTIAFIGFLLVIISQNFNYADIQNVRNLINKQDLIGVSIALIAAVLSGFTVAFTVRWGVDLAKQAKPDQELLFVMLAYSITGMISGVVMAIIGVLVNETLTYHQTSTAIMWGFLISPFAATLIRAANITTNHLAINTITFSRPIFSILWLALFSLINVANIYLLILGTLIIVVSNLLINTNSNARTDGVIAQGT